jgi:hypothetical protein
MRERLGEFALSLHPDKTRLIEFGRFAAVDRKRRGLGKPETFAFEATARASAPVQGILRRFRERPCRSP